MICDKVPFDSYVLKKEWNIATRSPNYPRSNGLTEKAVGISNNLLKKSIEEKKDVYESLMQYRTSLLKHIG